MASSFLTLPNALSASRLVFAPVLLAATVYAVWWASLVIFYLAVLTDLLDGPIARRLDQASDTGAKLDHIADAVFVFFALAALSWMGYFTWFLCIVQSVSFLLYFAESALPSKPLRGSMLGKANGFAYFFVAGIPITQSSMGWYPITPGVLALMAWVLVATSLVSIVQRYVSRISTN